MEWFYRTLSQRGNDFIADWVNDKRIFANAQQAFKFWQFFHIHPNPRSSRAEQISSLIESKRRRMSHQRNKSLIFFRNWLRGTGTELLMHPANQYELGVKHLRAPYCIYLVILISEPNIFELLSKLLAFLFCVKASLCFLIWNSASFKKRQQIFVRRRFLQQNKQSFKQKWHKPPPVTWLTGGRYLVKGKPTNIITDDICLPFYPLFILWWKKHAYLGEFDTLGLDLSGVVEAGGLLQGTVRRLLCLVNPGHQQSQQTFKTKQKVLWSARHKDSNYFLLWNKEEKCVRYESIQEDWDLRYNVCKLRLNKNVFPYKCRI